LQLLGEDMFCGGVLRRQDLSLVWGLSLLWYCLVSFWLLGCYWCTGHLSRSIRWKHGLSWVFLPDLKSDISPSPGKMGLWLACAEMC